METKKYFKISLMTILAISSLHAQQGFGEITIYGEKVEKKFQETNSSVQVFDEVAFTNSSKLNNLYDLFTQTSNVNKSGDYEFNIRGISNIGITGFYTGPKTINVTLDGVSQGANSIKDGLISTWDMQQAEIYKGPQSTIQGRNSLAGAIVLKSKDPEFTQNGAFQMGYGQYNNYQLSMMQTGPVNENLALRLAVDQKRSDGYVNNDKLRNDKFNKETITNIRAKALYKFDNEASALLTIGKVIHDDLGSVIVANEPFKRNSAWNTDGYYNTKSTSYALDINIPINLKWSFQALSTYFNDELERKNDFDFQNGYAKVNFDRESKTFAQEFRLTYKDEMFESLIGLYYGKGKDKDKQNSSQIDASSLGVPNLKVGFTQDLKEKYSNASIFFNTDYFVNKDLTLIFGGRLDQDKRENDNNISARRESDHGPINGFIDGRLTSIGDGEIKDKNKTTNFLPKIGFNYKWNDSINTGFTYTKGYRPGGISTNPVEGKAQKFQAEHTQNYEVSFKSLWLNNNLSFNTNIFYTKWKDQQVSQIGRTGSPFDLYIVNAGESTTKGIELESKYEISKTTDIYGSLGYTKAEFEDFKSGSKDYTGKDLINTPNLSANLGINYRNEKGYFLGTNIIYMGSKYADLENTQKIKAHEVVNLKIGYEENDWSLYAYANNLFDKEYVLNKYRNNSYNVGDPRVVGINFIYNW